MSTSACTAMFFEPVTVKVRARSLDHASLLLALLAAGQSVRDKCAQGVTQPVHVLACSCQTI